MGDASDIDGIFEARANDAETQARATVDFMGPALAQAARAGIVLDESHFLTWLVVGWGCNCCAVTIVVLCGVLINLHALGPVVATQDLRADTISACLFHGPTPNMTAYYSESFPVPGLCESILNVGLVAKHSDKTYASSREAAKPHSSLQIIAKICRAMWQGPRDDIKNERVSDKDLAELGATDETANLWCKTSHAKQFFPRKTAG